MKFLIIFASAFFGQYSLATDLKDTPKPKFTERSPSSLPSVYRVGDIKAGEIVKIEDRDYSIVCYAVSSYQQQGVGNGAGISCVHVK